VRLVFLREKGRTQGKGRTLVIVPLCAYRRGVQPHGAHQAASLIPAYTFPAIAGNHLPTMKGWRVE